MRLDVINENTTTKSIILEISDPNLSGLTSYDMTMRVGEDQISEERKN